MLRGALESSIAYKIVSARCGWKKRTDYHRGALQAYLLSPRAVHRLYVEKPSWEDNIRLQSGSPY